MRAASWSRRGDGGRWWRAAAGSAVGVAAVGAVILPAQMAGAATPTVTTCAGSGPGSLPAVIAGAGAGDTVTFAPVLSCPPAAPIEPHGTIVISRSLVITGPGARAMAVSGGGTNQVFSIAIGTTVSMSGITIENGSNTTGSGGGIFNEGTLTLTNSTVSANKASLFGGGGIFNDGRLNVIDSTVSNNASDAGGGIFNTGATGVLNLTGSTVSGNTSAGGGGGIYNYGRCCGSFVPSTVNVGATIVAGNYGGNCADVLGVGIIDQGYNLTDDHTGAACRFTQPSDKVNVDPLLSPLQNNGGPTKTLLPALNSPAVAMIPTGTTVNGVSVCPRTDQRGVASVGQCTTGAVKAGFVLSTPSLPAATPGASYGPVTLTTQEAGKSTSPYATTLKWKKVSLPDGLKLSNTGALSGTPSHKLRPGASSITVQVTETVTTVTGKSKTKTKAKTTVQATIPLTIT